MKTTIKLSDALFNEVKHYAKANQITMKDLVERGLRAVWAEQRAQTPFKLHDASVTGNGLSPEFQHVGWDHIREVLYHSRIK